MTMEARIHEFKTILYFVIPAEAGIQATNEHS